MGYNNHSKQNVNKKNNNQTNDRLTIPYNFVSLPKKSINAPCASLMTDDRDEGKINAYKAYVTAEGHYSGYINLTITNKTPLYIGGGNTINDTVKFFGPSGKPVIPGSSLRGMTKNLLKILTAGAMRPFRTSDLNRVLLKNKLITDEEVNASADGDVLDRHLYYRDFASATALKKLYSNEMVENIGPRETKTKASPGFLYRTDKGQYFVAPAKPTSVEGVYYDKNRALIQWERDAATIYSKKRIRENKQGKYHIFGADFSLARRIPVPITVIDSYSRDTVKEKVDLLDKQYAKTKEQAKAFTGLDDVDFVIPCFYMTAQEKVKHFGHGGYYRISYVKSITDHISEENKNISIDFSDALFGRSSLWASRLYFEDAKLQGEPRVQNAAYSKILISPKPTSYQLYLKQENEQKAEGHWDNISAPLRGYKLYWHQNIGNNNWQNTGDHIQGQNKIEPLVAGHTFTSKLRFESLSLIELGALLSVFRIQNLEEAKGKEIVYKIGQGKSIGLGSISIKAEVHVDDAAARYTSLFADKGWNEGALNHVEKEAEKGFSTYMKEQLGKGYSSYEVTLKELCLMMDWKVTTKKDWAKKVEYAPVTSTVFKYRTVLKTPEKFVRDSQ